MNLDDLDGYLTTAAKLILVVAIVYLAWHVWLAVGLHVSPQEWVEQARSWLVGQMPVLPGGGAP